MQTSKTLMTLLSDYPYRIDLAEFAIRLTATRKSRFLSQDELAQIIGLSTRQYQKYENVKNTVHPSMETVGKLHQALNTSLSFLYYGVGPSYVGKNTQNSLYRLAERYTDPSDHEFNVLLNMLLEIPQEDKKTVLKMVSALLMGHAVL